MNVTPLIDVLLVLIIIFMVITPLTPEGTGCAGAPTATAECPENQLHRTIVAVDRPGAGQTAALKINQEERPGTICRAA